MLQSAPERHFYVKNSKIFCLDLPQLEGDTPSLGTPPPAPTPLDACGASTFVKFVPAALIHAPPPPLGPDRDHSG